MSRLLNPLIALSYLLCFGAPKAHTLLRRDENSAGELAGKSLGFVLLLEISVRIMVVVVIAVIVESSIGSEVYEVLRVDRVLGVLIGVGVLHCLAYLLSYDMVKRRSESYAKAVTVYRIFRNFSYSIVGVLPVFLAINFLENFKGFSSSEIRNPSYILIFWFLFMAVLGFAEAFLVKRNPYKTDIFPNIRKDNDETYTPHGN